MKISSFFPQGCTGNPEDLTCEGYGHETCRAESYFKKIKKIRCFSRLLAGFYALTSAWLHLFLFFPADLVSVLGDLLFSE